MKVSPPFRAAVYRCGCVIANELDDTPLSMCPECGAVLSRTWVA